MLVQHSRQNGCNFFAGIAGMCKYPCRDIISTITVCKCAFVTQQFHIVIVTSVHQQNNFNPDELKFEAYNPFEKEAVKRLTQPLFLTGWILKYYYS